MSEANAPFDSAQPESNQPEVNPSESRVEPASSGRPKAFSELKALTDLAEVGSEGAPTAEAGSVWHNVRQNSRSAHQPFDQSPASTPTADLNPSLSSDDEIELDISKIFDASALDGLAFETETNAAAQPDLTLPELSEIDLWADPNPGPGSSGPDARAASTVNFEPSQTESGQIAANLAGAEDWSTADSSTADSSTAEIPSLANLIGLIQELNQCNGVLMDRVSQLEDALETSQSALQAEVGRIHDTEVGQDWNNSQDWATVQDQVANLFNQLEFAHQTNQRQQILIETLTSQIENSQERVAQLEREAALVQQRYDEQAQLLVKSEHTNRDLQARLQRQQRYTLQFKVALERSLEVAAPSYETSLYEVNPAESKPLVETWVENGQVLPKAKQIQPWSAQAQLPLSQSTWMKLQNSLPPLANDRPSPADEDSFRLDAALDQAQPEMMPARSAQMPDSFEMVGPDLAKPDLVKPEPVVKAAPSQADAAAPATSHLNLPAFGMPLLQYGSDDAVGASAPDPQPAPELSDPMLSQLDEVVKPLADMLAEAMLASSASSNPPATPAVTPQSTNPDELLASVMADAEDALWQDLARLIDVSTEDVVKASLSGDLAAFESIDFAALNPSAALPEPPASQQPDAPLPASDATAIAPWLRRQNQAASQPVSSPASSPAVPAAHADEPVPELDQQSDQAALSPSSWPSPIVYPLRPVKKRHSLAMVDLPTFPNS